MNKILRILTPIILVFAIILFTFLGIKSVKNKKTFNETPAVITSISVEERGDDKIHHVLVRYSVDGIEYENELGVYSSSMKEGKEINIIYNPENVNEIDEAGYMSIIMYFILAVISMFMLAALAVRILNGRY